MSQQNYRRVAIFAIALMMVFAIGIYQQAIAVSHYCKKIQFSECQNEPGDRDNAPPSGMGKTLDGWN